VIEPQIPLIPSEVEGLSRAQPRLTGMWSSTSLRRLPRLLREAEKPVLSACLGRQSKGSGQTEGVAAGMV
jgi:hypothetical protein